uniref:Putative RND multidrug efflux protein n=1 Tax=Magnetococcus massalia (strain MO-1) TaxID=451514 RepID=A0A1S7LH06_MAGMO|nr:Putative RND multidrug efflux protein [Candidatus Magnetococcus massalia]
MKPLFSPSSRFSLAWVALLLAALPIHSVQAGEDDGQFPLAFPVAGVVKMVLAKQGASVRTGEVLAQLDGKIYQTQRQAALMALKSAGLKLKFAQGNYKRVKQMYDDLNTSAEDLEVAELGVVQAEAALAAVQAKLAKAQWQLDHTTLRAPRAGRVAAVPGYAGLVVDPQSHIQPIVVLKRP